MSSYHFRQMTEEEAAAKKARIDALCDEVETAENAKAARASLEEQRYNQLFKAKMEKEAAEKRRLQDEAKALEEEKNKKEKCEDSLTSASPREEEAAPIEILKRKKRASKKNLAPKAPKTPKTPKAVKTKEDISPIHSTSHPTTTKDQSTTFHHPSSRPKKNNAPAVVPKTSGLVTKNKRNKRINTMVSQKEMDLANQESMRAASGGREPIYNIWMKMGPFSPTPQVNQAGGTRAAPISLDSDDEKEAVDVQKPAEVVDETVTKVKNGLNGSVDFADRQNNPTTANGENHAVYFHTQSGEHDLSKDAPALESASESELEVQSSARQPMANITDMVHVPKEIGSAKSNKRSRDKKDEGQDVPPISPRPMKKPRVTNSNPQASEPALAMSSPSSGDTSKLFVPSFRRSDGSFDHEAFQESQMRSGPPNVKKKSHVPRVKKGESSMYF